MSKKCSDSSEHQRLHHSKVMYNPPVHRYQKNVSPYYYDENSNNTSIDMDSEQLSVLRNKQEKRKWKELNNSTIGGF